MEKYLCTECKEEFETIEEAEKHWWENHETVSPIAQIYEKL